MRIFMLVLLLSFLPLCALQVPFSHEPVKTPENHIGDLKRSDPPDAAPIPLATDAWVWHDGRFLYVWFEMAIDDTFTPGVNATWDDYQNSDYARVQLSTMPENHFAYFFAVYPRGNCVDAVRNEDLGLDNAWNSHLESETRHEGNLWTCLFKIPFRDLRFSGSPPYRWGINIARRDEHRRSSYVSPFCAAALMTRDEYFAAVVPLEIREPIEMPRNYMIAPSFYRSYDMIEDTNSFDPENVGLTVVYRPTSTSSAKFAFNPDFSDVPVDEERDSHNDKYAPSLNETRLFFTEDINAFGVGSNLFYSRTIMQPKYAAKYTSNTRHWTFGFLNAVDKETRENGEVVNPDDVYSIAAAKSDYGPLNCQFTVLNRFNNDRDYANTVLHLLPEWKLNDSATLRLFYNQSMDKLDTLDTAKGYMTGGSLGYHYKRFDSSTYLTRVSEDFMPGMGSSSSQSERDYTQVGTNLNIFATPTRMGPLYFAQWSVNASANQENKDLDSTRSADANAYFEFRLRPRLTLTTSPDIACERWNGKLITSHWTNFNASWYQFAWAEITLGYSTGHLLHYGLGDSYYANSLSVSWSGVLGPYLSYILRNNHTIWYGMPKIPGLDPKYDVTNLDMEITFTNTVKLVSGVRFNNYHGYYTKSHTGYFSTLRWDYNPSTRFFLGIRHSEDDFYGTSVTSAETAWFKVYREF